MPREWSPSTITELLERGCGGKPGLGKMAEPFLPMTCLAPQTPTSEPWADRGPGKRVILWGTPSSSQLACQGPRRKSYLGPVRPAPDLLHDGLIGQPVIQSGHVLAVGPGGEQEEVRPCPCPKHPAAATRHCLRAMPSMRHVVRRSSRWLCSKELDGSNQAT